MGGLRSLFLMVMGLHIIGLIVMIFVRFPRRKGHPSSIERAVADRMPQGDGVVPVHN
jgi:hypothetical protein